jgi:hypothetical protein
MCGGARLICKTPAVETDAVLDWLCEVGVGGGGW